MITAFFLNIFISLISFVLVVLPEYSLPAGLTDAVQLIWGYVHPFAFLFPIATLSTVLGIAVFFHLSLLGYDLFLKVYAMIRGKCELI